VILDAKLNVAKGVCLHVSIQVILLNLEKAIMIYISQMRQVNRLVPVGMPGFTSASISAILAVTFLDMYIHTHVCKKGNIEPWGSAGCSYLYSSLGLSVNCTR
jgi:hypothetical protein